MSFLIAGAAVVGIGAGIYTSIQGSKAKKEAQDAQTKAQQEMNRNKAAYEKLDTTNPYLDMENKFQENVYEDLTVNQQEAQFIKQQQQQQQANIMQQMGGAAGGSGIAALAQAMSNQGQLAAQRAAVSIGQQEAANQKLAAQGELIVQKGEQNVENMRLEGEVLSREWEQDKMATLLGMSQAEVGAAGEAVAAGQQTQMQGIGMIGSTAGKIAGGAASDIRLKDNITKTGVSESGIPIYTFNYKGDDTIWSGTMAQDLIELGREDAVTIMDNGYYGVYYDMVDVNMKRLNNR